jgi:hypothetical protein
MIKMLKLHNCLYIEMDAAYSSKIFLTTYKTIRHNKTKEHNIRLLTLHSNLSSLLCMSLKFGFSLQEKKF